MTLEQLILHLQKLRKAGVPGDVPVRITTVGPHAELYLQEITVINVSPAKDTVHLFDEEEIPPV